MKYIYKNKEVQLVPGQQFTTGWNVYYPMDTEDGGTRMVIEMAIPPGQVGANLKIVDDNAVIAIDGGKKNVDAVESPDAVNINQVTFTEMHKSLPGIGRTSAKKIMSNKPPGGYESLEQLKDLNSDIDIVWEELNLVF